MEHILRAREDTSAPVSFTHCEAKDRPALLLAAILASSLGFIDGSVTAIAMPAMRLSLEATLAGSQWVSNAYLLVLSALVLAGGALGDRFGVARIFRTGIAIFVAASLACALARDTGQMIAARTIQGFGAALMVPSSMALIARIYPREERGRALGIWAAASTATTALGPVLGGLMITFGPDGAWRLIFAINLPFGILAWWLLKTRIRRDEGRPGHPVDVPGAALATLGLGLAAFALTSPGRFSLGIGAAGVTALILFVAWQARTPHPMMRLGLFRNPGFAAANLATFFLYFGLSATMFCLPMIAITAWGVTELGVTAAFVPTSLLIGILSAPAGRLADRIGAAPLMTAGCALVALAYAGLALTADQAAFWQRAVPCMVLSALGMALVVAPLTAAVMAAAGDEEQGAASGINNAVARIAGLLAVALAGSIAAWGYGAASDTAPGFGLPSPAPAHIAASGAAFGAVAAVAAAAAGLAALISALSLRRRERAAKAG